MHHVVSPAADEPGQLPHRLPMSARTIGDSDPMHLLRHVDGKVRGAGDVDLQVIVSVQGFHHLCHVAGDASGRATKDL
jgi:hypothetical protein